MTYRKGIAVDDTLANLPAKLRAVWREESSLNLFGEALINGTEANRDTKACLHPSESQILNRNLFTGAFDLVCSQCNATIAEDYQK